MFPEPQVVFHGHLASSFVLDFGADHTLVSEEFLKRCFGHDPCPSRRDAFGRDTLIGPFAVTTAHGLYMTNQLIYISSACNLPDVVLGRDWLCHTGARMRIPEMRFEDWEKSWGDERCAWFSWTYVPHADPGDPPSPVLWAWVKAAFGIVHQDCLRKRKGLSYSCGAINTTYSYGPRAFISRRATFNELPAPSRPRTLATAADLPQELFEHILAYVGTDRRGRYRIVEGVRDLMRCSLVCAEWAQRCRTYIFLERPLKIHTIEELSTLVTYTRTGSTRLRGIQGIIHLRIYQKCTTRSWCHTVYGSGFLSGKNELEIQGPVSDVFPISALQTPHWSLPKTMPSCYSDFSSLTIRKIRFPALSDFGKLIAHFKRTFAFRFDQIEWDNTDVWIPSRSRDSTIRTPVNIHTENCKIDGLIDIQARLIFDSRHHNLAFNHLTPQDQCATLALYAFLDGCATRPRRFVEKRFWASMGYYYNPSFICSLLTVPELDTSNLKIELWFLGRRRTGTDKPDTLDIRAILIGTSLWGVEETHRLRVAEKYASAYSELRMGRFLSLRTVFLCFKTFERLQYTATAFPQLRTPILVRGHPVLYHLVCARSESHPFADIPSMSESDWVGIDPNSLRTTGDCWKSWLPEQVEKEYVLAA